MGDRGWDLSALVCGFTQSPRGLPRLEGLGLSPCVVAWAGHVTHTQPWPRPSSPPCSPASSRSPCIMPPLAFCMPRSEISRSRLQVCNLGKTNKRRAAWLYLSETQRLCFAGNFDRVECKTSWKKNREKKIKNQVLEKVTTAVSKMKSLVSSLLAPAPDILI